MERRRTLCPDDMIKSIMASAKTGKSADLSELEELLRIYADDPRLYFLKGSWLAGEGDYKAARAALRQALDLAPDYAIARFQLGLLELTSGEPMAALETWGPLHGLAPDHYLRVFVTGLCHLIRDEFADAVRCLEHGISLNHENEPMNHDMQQIIDEVRTTPRGQQSGERTVSSVDLLLKQAALKSRH